VLIAQGEKKPFTRLERALQDNPDNQQLRLQYARLLTASDMAAAREQFEILSAQSPRDGDLLLSLALINREIGDDLAAKAYLKQMLAAAGRRGALLAGAYRRGRRRNADRHLSLHAGGRGIGIPQCQ
jgi:predicted Zn-dependent protease